MCIMLVHITLEYNSEVNEPVWCSCTYIMLVHITVKLRKETRVRQMHTHHIRRVVKTLHESNNLNNPKGSNANSCKEYTSS